MDEQERQQLIVQMETLPVEIWSLHTSMLRGEVFLRAPQLGTDRGDTLGDILRDRAFFPLKTPEKLLFVATRYVAWARVDLLSAVDELDADVENDPNACTAVVVVELVDGGKLEGLLRYSQPINVHRLGDHLERLPPFFQLRTEDWLYLVNASAVASVTPLEEKR